jgi:hypothetical protein
MVAKGNCIYCWDFNPSRTLPELLQQSRNSPSSSNQSRAELDYSTYEKGFWACVTGPFICGIRYLGSRLLYARITVHCDICFHGLKSHVSISDGWRFFRSFILWRFDIFQGARMWLLMSSAGTRLIEAELSLMKNSCMWASSRKLQPKRLRALQQLCFLRLNTFHQVVHQVPKARHMGLAIFCFPVSRRSCSVLPMYKCVKI